MNNDLDQLAKETDSRLRCGMYSSQEAANNATEWNIAKIRSALEQARQSGYGDGYVDGSNFQISTMMND